MYPDMEDYMGAKSLRRLCPQVIIGGRPGRFRFRRRNLGRDFITALILSRLFGRRRSFPPFWVFKPDTFI